MEINRCQALAFTDAVLGCRTIGILGAGENAEDVSEPKAPEAQAILSAVIGSNYLSDYWIRKSFNDRPVTQSVEARKKLCAYLHAVADALEFEER